MKRVFFCSVLVLLILLTAAGVRADVLVEPENAFYNTHQSECRHRDYRVYASSEPTSVYTAPYGMRVKTFETGGDFGVEWIYEHADGSVWGYCYQWDGWVPLGGMKLRYDFIAFAKDHADKITQNDERKPYSEFFDAEDAAVYAYPGGPFAYRTGGFSEGIPESFYTDPDGKQWAFVGYQYGRINKWVCLDAPQDELLGTKEAALVDSEYTSLDNSTLPQPSGFITNTVFWVVGTVVLVSGTAAILLVIILKKRRKQK